ncbi:Aste57867_10109 [Aphanomyces stellatus]|uniref:Aste57867_10109 protein n=1 Tax=Aphanomyces stellatus TaxID=120398 RepID=A0A485KPI7_9STRA|nr:hypothetical protein As57867_010070 [Aphanomyces stellatus]VFT86985.1 Aste57867_10109 [Aphanomyces stellatus]
MRVPLLFLVLHSIACVYQAALVYGDPSVKTYISTAKLQLEARVSESDDTVPQDIPSFDGVVKAAYAVLASNFDDKMNATLPGPIGDIGFQHLVRTFLHASTHIGPEIPRRTAGGAGARAPQLHAGDQSIQVSSFHSLALLQHQWPNGFMPDIVYGPDVGASLVWLPTNKTFYPGPAYWSLKPPTENSTAGSSSGILASPLHAETAMRIFNLSPLDTSMSTPVYTHEAMTFLCDVFPPLTKFHTYLLASRRTSNTSLLSLRHPWESVAAVGPGWKPLMATIKRASDYSQVISRLQIPATATEAFASHVAVFYPDPKEAVADIYEPMLYLASCFVAQEYDEAKMRDKCAAAFDVVDVEFNAVFLRSAESLLDMARLLFQPTTKLGFSCDVELRKADIQALADVAAGLKSQMEAQLWDPKDMMFKSDNHLVTGFFPLFASTLNDTIQMGLMRHLLPTPNTFHFFCDNFPVSIFPCAETTASANRPLLIVHNYLLYRGFVKNTMHGIARFLLHRTFALVSSASPIRFAAMFDATTGDPVPPIATSSSTLAAAIVLNMGLPDVTTPPSPDTPPIDRQAILIVMCVELVVAMAVAVSCVVFSVYFVVKRPREGGGDGSLSPVAAAAADDDADDLSPNSATPMSESRQLEESLLSEDEDHDEYGSFLASPSLKPAEGLLSSAKQFVSSISPWG